MRAADGRIVLADFGAGSDGSEPGAAAGGDRTGTPLYLATEVLAKHPASPQSDIYSLGAVLFHLLTGSFPLVGRTIDDLRQAHAAGERRRLRGVRPDVPARLSRIVGRCLAPNPADRFQDVAAVAQALRGAGGRAWTARRALTTAAVLLTVVGVSFAFARYSRSPLAPPGPPSTSAETLSLRRVLSQGSTSVSEDGRYILRGAFVRDLVSGAERRWRPADEMDEAVVDPRMSREACRCAGSTAPVGSRHQPRAGVVAGWSTARLRIQTRWRRSRRDHRDLLRHDWRTSGTAATEAGPCPRIELGA
jgi:hypothetical protein